MTGELDRLELIDVSRHFGRRKALTHVSLTCRRSEIVGLLGPNGAGKSTLLAIVSTLVLPSAGDVRYGGRTRDEMGVELRRHLGLLGHDLHLYPELTARENLTFFGELYGVANLRTRVGRALEEAALADRGDDPVSAFSRGMRQRLALERSLLHDPTLILMDEPFTGLDDASGRALIARLRGLKAQGCIVLLATHDLDLAEEVIDRAIVLREGRLIPVPGAAGTLRERYRHAIHR